MNRSPNDRYRARRRAVETRRRAVLVAGAASVIVVGLLLGLLWPRRSSAPGPEQAQLPTSIAAPSAAASPIVPTLPVSTPVGEPAPAPEQESVPDQPAAFFDSRRLTYEPGFYSPQIQAFLDEQPGPLKGLVMSVGGRPHTFAEVLIGQSIYYSLNPKVVLALLESQSGLITAASPSDDQMAWAIDYRGENGNRRGLRAQVRWTVRQIVQARRDFRQYTPLTYADGTSAPPPAGMELSQYAIARVLAPTTSPDQLAGKLQRFVDTYTRLFGDPRIPPSDWPSPAEPFMIRPMERTAQVTSFFDHDAPFLSGDGSTFSYWGRAEPALSYDGHDGWDYAAGPPEMALAAADGEVVFAGNADDNCETRAVVIDHGNGYRTLYWHLYSVDVQIGERVQAAQPVGMIGESGCALGAHLHLGVQFLGRNTDPYGWCGGDIADPWQANPAGMASTWLWKDRPSPCGPAPDGAVVVDTDSPGFARSGELWQTAPLGYGGGALYVPSLRGADAGQPWKLRPLAEPSVAAYRPELPAAGTYRVYAYVPYAVNGLDDATRVRYRIGHSGGESEVFVDMQVYANDWVDLGTYSFDPADTPLVTLSNLAEEGQRGVWADAIMWVPVV